MNEPTRPKDEFICGARGTILAYSPSTNHGYVLVEYNDKEFRLGINQDSLKELPTWLIDRHIEERKASKRDEYDDIILAGVHVYADYWLRKGHVEKLVYRTD